MWSSQQDKSEMSQRAPGTWHIFLYSLERIHKIRDSPFLLQSPSLHLWDFSYSTSRSSLPGCSPVQWDQVPHNADHIQPRVSNGRTTVRDHRWKPASTFHSLLQLTPHVVSALTPSKSKWLENKTQHISPPILFFRGTKHHLRSHWENHCKSWIMHVTCLQRSAFPKIHIPGIINNLTLSSHQLKLSRADFCTLYGGLGLGPRIFFSRNCQQGKSISSNTNRQLNELRESSLSSSSDAVILLRPMDSEF